MPEMRDGSGAEDAWHGWRGRDGNSFFVAKILERACAHDPGADPRDGTRRSWFARRFDFPRQIGKWIEFVLTTPVVLWAGGFFFTRAWRSVVNRSLNMFTLIAVGVGAAYFYSAVAVIMPGIFSAAFQRNGDIDLYFEAAAVITT